jgi:hypothetical protein
MLWFFIRPGRGGKYYHHYDHDDDDESNWEIALILLAIWGAYTGIIHFLDWLTFDIVPWYIEPLTILPTLLLLIMCVEYGTNPLYWWPLVWGTRVELKEYVKIDKGYLKKLGGPLRVYQEDWSTLKFRRKRDAFAFMMFRNL